MFLTLIDNSLLNITKISKIIFENNFTITYGLINGKNKKEVFNDEESFNTRKAFLKENLLVK